MPDVLDVIVIGGGQSALACGYYLKRKNINYKILDKQEQCGGSWQHSWDSLTLFSPAEHSSLPGWLMPTIKDDFPPKNHVIDYLCNYEKRYTLPVERPVNVESVLKKESYFKVITDKTIYFSKVVISATGTWERPFIPKIKGIDSYTGRQIHAVDYKNPEGLKAKKVLIVGEGNSGAQILSEVSQVAETKWATHKTPEFLPDDVDGRVLFNVASAKYKAQNEGKAYKPANYNLGSIVMTPSVIEGRERGALIPEGNINRIYEEGVIWENGLKEKFDIIIWCTGFNFATEHLQELVEVYENGRIETRGTKVNEVPGLWLVGYGNWTGFASATLIGVGRSARKTISEVSEYIRLKIE